MKTETTTIAHIMDMSQKTAIVTGGAVGIGLGIARRLAEAGAHVVIADRNEQNAESAARELTESGWRASAIAGDVSREDDVRRIVEHAVSVGGGVDILVNNAGIYPVMPIVSMPVETFDTILAVNLKSTFLCTKYVAEVMIRQGRGGKIINITSIDALHPSAVGLAAYDASKHGMWGFTKNSALELAPHNIQVNAIAPGGIRTPGTGVGAPSTPALDAIQKKFIEKIPMKRMGEPDEIGKVALFLASDCSSYMTGSQVVVDGGVLLS